MAIGDPVDIQREKRWPQQTPLGLKVDLKPWQEDSDYSDEEGVFPPPEGFEFKQFADEDPVKEKDNQLWPTKRFQHIGVGDEEYDGIDSKFLENTDWKKNSVSNMIQPKIR